MAAVSWQYQNVRGTRYVLVNGGDKMARQVLIDDVNETGAIRRTSANRMDIAPGDNIDFHVVSWSGMQRPRLRITWFEDGSDEMCSEETNMVLR